MLVVETVARIRRAHFGQGKSIKAISRELGIARNTVRRVLRSGETAFVYEREVLARAGYLSEVTFGGWQWTCGDETTASIQITGARDAVTLDYRIRSHGEDWHSVHQRVPIRWTPCRLGGERPWFVCNLSANGIYCGRQVTTLYGAGRLFACRRCYRLGYAVQRGGPMDRAHHRLRRLHRKLGADYNGPNGIPPPKPKWMRWRTYSRLALQIRSGEGHLNHVFTVGAERILARIDRSERRKGIRR